MITRDKFDKYFEGLERGKITTLAELHRTLKIGAYTIKAYLLEKETKGEVKITRDYYKRVSAVKKL